MAILHMAHLYVYIYMCITHARTAVNKTQAPKILLRLCVACITIAGVDVVCREAVYVVYYYIYIYWYIYNNNIFIYVAGM